jgi:3-oxoacid CoA-transferase subunit B
VITDLGAFEVDTMGNDGMVLIEMASGVTLDEITAKTQAKFRVGLT